MAWHMLFCHTISSFLCGIGNVRQTVKSNISLSVNNNHWMCMRWTYWNTCKNYYFNKHKSLNCSFLCNTNAEISVILVWLRVIGKAYWWPSRCGTISPFLDPYFTTNGFNQLDFWNKTIKLFRYGHWWKSICVLLVSTTRFSSSS